MKKLRILICTDPDTVHSMRLVNNLNKKIQVGLFWFGAKRNYSDYSVPCFPLILKRPINIRGLWRISNYLPFYSSVKLFKPDLIHVHREASWCKKFKHFAPEIPVVFTSWGHIPENLLYGKWGTQLVCCDGFTGDATTLIDELKKVPGCETTASLIFRFGISESSFKPVIPSFELRKTLSIPINSKVVYSPRSLRIGYNHETLVQAIPEILSSVPDTYFIFANNHGHRYPDSVEYKANLENMIRSLGAESHVRFLEHVADHRQVAVRYQEADVVVSIPLEDGFPATIFEAMACGTPLVVSSLEDYRDVIDENNAISVNPKNTSEVAKAVIRVLSSDAEHERLRQAGLKTFEEKGKMENEMDKLLAFYQELINSK